MKENSPLLQENLYTKEVPVNELTADEQQLLILKQEWKLLLLPQAIRRSLNHAHQQIQLRKKATETNGKIERTKEINNTTHFLLNAKQNRKIDQFTEIIKYAERNVTWSILFYSFLTDKRKQYGQRVCHLLYHWKRECGFVYSGKILCFGWHITLGIQETFEEVNGLRSIPQGKEKILNMKAYEINTMKIESDMIVWDLHRSIEKEDWVENGRNR